MSAIVALQSMEFEDEEIIFIEHDGKKLYPVFAVGNKFGYSEKNALEAFRTNLKFLKGNHYSPKIRRYQRAVSVPCLTGEGVLIYSSRLGIERLPEDRQDKIIRTVQFMAKAAMGVLDGSLVPRFDISIWKEERLANSINHRLTMGYVKKYEVPKSPPGSNPHDLYPRESRAINEDALGIHIKGASDKLNVVGLHIKNDAHVADRALMEAGIEFETRHKIVRSVLDNSYPNRTIEDLLLTTEEKARITRKCPASQRGISDFTAVA